MSQLVTTVVYQLSMSVIITVYHPEQKTGYDKILFTLNRETIMFVTQHQHTNVNELTG